MNELVDLARQFSADKREAVLEAYERYFRGFRDTATSVFEIGVKRGGSIRTWEAYFPNARIIGMDLRPVDVAGASDRVTILQGDQGDLDHLRRIGAEHGPFDVILDDGSHLPRHQQEGFETLWPFLKVGGLYIVEDVHTRRKEAEASAADWPLSSVAYFMRFADTVVNQRTEYASLSFDYSTLMLLKRGTDGFESKPIRRLQGKAEKAAKAPKVIRILGRLRGFGSALLYLLRSLN